jgi:hypothetical protein
VTTMTEPRPLVEYLNETRNGVYFRVGQDTRVKWHPKYCMWMCLDCRKSDCPHTRVVAESDEGLSLIRRG